MNIWCISKYASPPKYGVAARIYYLAKEFVRLGHSTVLISSDSNHLADYPETKKSFNKEIIDGIEHIWFRNKKYKKTASISRVLSWFDFEKSLFRMKREGLPKPDVVIVSSLSLLSIVYGYYLKKKYKAFLVLEIRDIWPLTLVAEGGVSRFHPLCLFLQFIESFGYRKSDLVVGTMPKLDRHVENILGYERPFFCSPLGFDKEVMEARVSVSDSDLIDCFPKDKVIVGYAGSMGIANNLDTFISCIENLSDLDNVHFMLVGGGDLRDSYEKRISRQSNVTFLPKISPSKVPVFLNQCDVLYLSTHDSEVWQYGQSMNKVVEYMYAGKPVIASYSGFPSMLNEAASGEFIIPNNEDVLKDTIRKYADMTNEERNAVGKKGSEWILKNRTYEKLASDYITVLGEGLEQRNGTGK